MEDDIMVESPIPIGTPVTWEGRGGIEVVGTVIGYLGDGLFTVMDEDEKEYEKEADELTEVE